MLATQGLYLHKLQRQMAQLAVQVSQIHAVTLEVPQASPPYTLVSGLPSLTNAPKIESLGCSYSNACYILPMKMHYLSKTRVQEGKSFILDEAFKWATVV